MSARHGHQPRCISKPLAVTAGPPRASGRRAAEPAGGLCLHLCRRARHAVPPSIGYGRYGNPTWQALEEAIGALEGGRALTFASGMAAAHAVLELVPPGGVIVIPHNCYLGVAEAVDRRAREIRRAGTTGQHRRHHARS